MPVNPLLLAIDTSTEVAGVAVLGDGAAVSLSWDAGRNQTTAVEGLGVGVTTPCCPLAQCSGTRLTSSLVFSRSTRIWEATDGSARPAASRLSRSCGSDCRS